MDHSELLSTIYAIQKEATKVALAEVGLVSPRINQTEAFRIYKRPRVEEWLNRGLLQPLSGPKKRRGSTIEYLREDLVRLSITGGASINDSPGRAKGTRKNKVP